MAVEQLRRPFCSLPYINILSTNARWKQAHCDYEG